MKTQTAASIVRYVARLASGLPYSTSSWAPGWDHFPAALASGWPCNMSLPTEKEASGCHSEARLSEVSMPSPFHITWSTMGSEPHGRGLAPWPLHGRQPASGPAWSKAQTKCSPYRPWVPRGQGFGLFHFHISRTWHNSWQTQILNINWINVTK